MLLALFSVVSAVPAESDRAPTESGDYLFYRAPFFRQNLIGFSKFFKQVNRSLRFELQIIVVTVGALAGVWRWSLAAAIAIETTFACAIISYIPQNEILNHLVYK